MKKYCKCGCGESTIKNRYSEYNKYIKGHTWKGKTRSQEAKINISKSKQGKNHPMWGKKHSEETKLKISRGNKGKHNHNGINNPMFGKHHSKKIKKRISEKLIGIKLSKEHIEKNRISHIGKHHSDETKLKIGNSNKGKIVSLESRLKMSKAQKKRFKNPEDHSMWRGGISKLPYGFDFDNDLKNLVRKRDNNKCQLCSKRKYRRDHSVHHIDYDKFNNDPRNLITLCMSCHMKTNGNRQKWIRLFSNMKMKNIRRIK